MTSALLSLSRPPGARFDALALAGPPSAKGLPGVLGLQVARSGLRLGFLVCVAGTVGRLVMQHSVDARMLAATGILLVLAGATGFAADRVQAAVETNVADALRTAAIDRLKALKARPLLALPVGDLVVSLQRHPDAVAALVIGHRAASLMMAIGPLIAAALLFVLSWQAAILLLSLTPVMIVFFALVGDAIRRRAAEQERAFGRLAGQFADRLRVLPTLLAHHAFATEEAKLADRLEVYAGKTLGVLRVAFANAAIIDFFASLSIAILAVLLGLGHLKLFIAPGFAGLALWQSLLILMIAPEYFAPFRRFSEQYHAKAEGRAAAAALDALLSVAPSDQPDLPVLDRLDLTLPVRGLVAITGPSGSGKSTLLRRIAGLEDGGDLAGGPVSWIAADSRVSGATLGAAIANGSNVSRTRLEGAARAIGLLDDEGLPGGLDAAIGRNGANLSGGQRLRIAVARALLSNRTVLADEPTAKLDPMTANAVRHALLDIARSRRVVAATHDGELARQAARTIDLSNGKGFEAAA